MLALLADSLASEAPYLLLSDLYTCEEVGDWYPGAQTLACSGTLGLDGIY